MNYSLHPPPASKRKKKETATLQTLHGAHNSQNLSSYFMKPTSNCRLLLIGTGEARTTLPEPKREKQYAVGGKDSIRMEEIIVRTDENAAVA